MNISYGYLHDNEPSKAWKTVVEQLSHVLAALDGEQGAVTEQFFFACINEPNCLVIIARDADAENRIVGTVTVNIVHMPDDIEGRIDDVAVLEAYRGIGIAEQLMRMAIDSCRERGALDIELTCAPHRVTAARLYQRLGFAELYTRVMKLKLTA